MKRIVQLLAPALVLMILAPPASSLNMTAGLSVALTDAVEASRAFANPIRMLRGAEYAISTFDDGVVKAFSKPGGAQATGLQTWRASC